MADGSNTVPDSGVPSCKAPDGRPHPNDIDPCASVTHWLAHGGPSDRDGPHLQELDLKMHDRDMALSVEVDKDHVRVLHMKNVRKDTLDEAQNAVDNFFDQIEPLGDDDSHGGTVFRMFDKVYAEIKRPIDVVLAEVGDFEELMYEIDDSDFTHPKKPKAATPEGLRQYFNPVAELKEICRHFLDQVNTVNDNAALHKHETCSKRNGLVVTKANDYSVHGRLTGYIGDQAEKCDLVFDWDETAYPGDMQRSLSRQPIFHVQSKECEGWRYNMSEGHVRLWYK